MTPTFTLCVMTQKGHAATNALLKSHTSLISQVIIGQDAALTNDYSEDIAKLCESHHVPFSFRKDAGPIDPDTYVFAISWRWMIEHPQDRLIIFHDSLLPKYRGFAPLVNMLINGEQEVGFTALFGAASYDQGAIIGQESSRISYPITIAEAIEQNHENLTTLALNIADHLARGETLQAAPQNEADASYSIWRDEDDYRIDWHEDAARIVRTIHALGEPYRGAQTMAGDQCIFIDEAEVTTDLALELRHPGKVLKLEDGCPIVICGQGLIKITRARFAQNGESCLPLTRFRTRFT